MKQEDFKKLQTRVLSKAGLVNMSLRKKLSYEEALKINDITADEFELMGWEYNQEMKLVQRVRYVSYKDIEETEDEEEYKEQPQQIENISDKNVIQLNDTFTNKNIEQLKGIFDNYEVIMQMIEMFKGNKSDLGKDKSIVIELPYEEDKKFQASYRVNKTINNQFKEFCKQHKEYTAKDLLSMALVEYMRNHN